MKNLGLALPEGLFGGGSKRREEIRVTGRGWTLSLFLIPLVGGFLLIFIRLVWLMVVLGESYRGLSEGNRVRIVNVRGVRGIIRDRNGAALVVNRPVYKLTDGRQISRERALALLSENREAEVVEEVVREYKLGERGAHILGYVGEASEAEVNKGGYKLEDVVGRGGIEEHYDERLRGLDGAKIVEVDTEGKTVRVLSERNIKEGEELVLSIDSELQSKTFEAMSKHTGAAIVSNPTTGEILSLVSTPSFDPDVFLKGDPQEVGEVLTGEKRPLFNRALSGVYPPGSTFKIVTAAAGLETGVINEGFRYDDNGFIRIGEQVFNNWYYTQYGGTEGSIGIVRAIARSTDTFFYKLGELVGIDRLAMWSRRFGLGRLTGIDIAGEVEGLVPDPKWRMDTKGERWFLGDTMIAAIGQGDLLLTPLQVHQMMSVIAGRGKLCKPRFVRGDGECEEVEISQKTRELIVQGMYEACSTGGTAFPLFDYPARVACKTGTAEFGDPEDKTHAWLTAFVGDEDAAKFGKETVAVTVLVEEGGEGSRVAAPIVRKILTAYFGINDAYNYSAIRGEGE